MQIYSMQIKCKLNFKSQMKTFKLLNLNFGQSGRFYRISIHVIHLSRSFLKVEVACNGVRWTPVTAVRLEQALWLYVNGENLYIYIKYSSREVNSINNKFGEVNFIARIQ